jgi:hypothetical protein
MSDSEPKPHDAFLFLAPDLYLHGVAVVKAKTTE